MFRVDFQLVSRNILFMLLVNLIERWFGGLLADKGCSIEPLKGYRVGLRSFEARGAKPRCQLGVLRSCDLGSRTENLGRRSCPGAKGAESGRSKHYERLEATSELQSHLEKDKSMAGEF